MKQIRKWMAPLLMLAALVTGSARAEGGDAFLPPEQAFQLQGELRDAHTVRLSWTIAPGYHLYRERLNFKAPGAGVGVPDLPAGLRKFDANFNKEMETYEHQLVVHLPITPAAKGSPSFVLQVGYQGCAEAGLCYSPATVSFAVDPATPGKLQVASAEQVAAAQAAASATPSNLASNVASSVASNAASNAPATPAAAADTSIATAAAPSSAPSASAAGAAQGAGAAGAPEDDSSFAQRTLQSGSVWRIGLAFLAFGLLLSFTPCVLPMVPILSSIIVGEGNVSRGRGFMLALAYCLGMALVYTSLGVAAGLAGEGLAGALQKPWVLLTFGALLVVLALSMFDVYQLQLPSALQSRLSQTSGNLRGGRFIGVFVMGAISALIVGPCVAGPLAGALLYISQTRNVWTGGWALFSMAAGMSVPLLLTGISAGSLLPRAGAWMNQVKQVFGLLLIAVAVWMVSPVFPVTVMMALWGSFAMLCAVMLRVFEPLASNGLRSYFSKTLGLVFLVAGLFELGGAASDGRDVLQPLGHLHTAAATVAAAIDEVHFSRIKTVADLDHVLASSNTPVMLDFYADWCTSCKEMERFTFSQPAVGGKLKQLKLIQVDVTANSDDDKALMKRFGLFGPPGIILFNGGKEIPNSRIIGFLAPEPFVQHLARHLAS